MTGCTVVYFLISILYYIHNRTGLYRDLITFGVEYAQMQKMIFENLAVPYGLLDEEGKILWANRELIGLIKKDAIGKKSIYTIFKGIPTDVLEMEEEKQIDISYEDRFFQLRLLKAPIQDVLSNSQMVGMQDKEPALVAMYLFDQTEIKRLQKENLNQKMVAGLIYLDNYEEAMESIEDVRRSVLVALIDRKINKYINNYGGIVKKIEKDKYFIALQQKYVAQLQSNKFSLIDEVKEVNIGNEMAVTISVGIGMNGDGYLQNCEYSRAAIELALGRGGDQAVVKDQENIYYYGGKTKQVEKNTRVKARVKAHALRELLLTKDRVLIMGHKLADVDSFGSAIGIHHAVTSLDKKAYIVLNDISTSLRPIVQEFRENMKYPEEIFIHSEEAREMVTENTVVIIVDANRPSITECPELLEVSKSVVVLDHHRQTSEKIENAVLSYIETYASSACEIVAEILQYITDGVKLKPAEADAMYAGIMIDTNNFTDRTGFRTFEAAAFLKRNGADLTKVRMLLRNSMEEHKAKAEVIRNAQVFADVFAIGICPSGNLKSPTIIGAQAANELLNIDGIEASFVLTEYNGKIYVSARSIDRINVQLVMERLGGGGHMSVAGAQIEDSTMEQALRTLKITLQIMKEEGDI